MDTKPFYAVVKGLIIVAMLVATVLFPELYSLFELA